MAVGAYVFFLFACELVSGGAIWAIMQLVKEWVEEDLDKRVRVLAVHFVFAFDPGLLVVDLIAPLGEVEVVLGRPAEILHAVGVVAVRPIMLLVEDGTEGRFVAI